MSLPRPSECPFCHDSRVAIDNRRLTKKYGKTIVWRCGKCQKLWTTRQFERLRKPKLQKRQVIKDRIHVEDHLKDFVEKHVEPIFSPDPSLIHDPLGHSAKIHSKNGAIIIEKGGVLVEQ
jgi:hypothetical protein